MQCSHTANKMMLNDVEQCAGAHISSHGIGEGETNVVVADGAYAHLHHPFNEYNIMK